MTAHVKALPRLHDELNSSHLTIHGAAEEALAVGFVMVNIADTFVSPGENEFPLRGNTAKVSKHKQPSDTARVLGKIEEIPRKSGAQGVGFDELGIVVVSCVNDGQTPVTIHTARPAPQPGEIFFYDNMIVRLAELYRARFG